MVGATLTPNLRRVGGVNLGIFGRQVGGGVLKPRHPTVRNRATRLYETAPPDCTKPRHLIDETAPPGSTSRKQVPEDLRCCPVGPSLTRSIALSMVWPFVPLEAFSGACCGSGKIAPRGAIPAERVPGRAPENRELAGSSGRSIREIRVARSVLSNGSRRGSARRDGAIMVTEGNGGAGRFGRVSGGGVSCLARRLRPALPLARRPLAAAANVACHPASRAIAEPAHS